MPTKMTKGQRWNADLSPETSGFRPVAHSSAVQSLAESEARSQVNNEAQPVYQVFIDGKAYEMRAARAGSKRSPYESVSSDLRLALREAGLTQHLYLVEELLSRYYTDEQGRLSVRPTTYERAGALIGKSASQAGRDLRALEKAGIIQGINIRGENLESPYGSSSNGKAYLVSYRKPRSGEQVLSATMTASAPITPEASNVESTGHLTGSVEITESAGLALPATESTVTTQASTAASTYALTFGADTHNRHAISGAVNKTGSNYVELSKTSAARSSSLASGEQISLLRSLMPSHHFSVIGELYGITDLENLSKPEARALIQAYRGEQPALLADIRRKVAERDRQQAERQQAERLASLDKARAERVSGKPYLEQIRRNLGALPMARK